MRKCLQLRHDWKFLIIHLTAFLYKIYWHG
ncbi:hypothetical protein TELCIR_12232 [Teladorsagia circumcincta]|uniref:Uncharacterized protein n=1 Tax=Teladorsagia circumcincta TaxID=45464 RepID=A0A2G9U8N0_TELCI|nr:hypothetical protein TELCIR_12232 [Teladorsagia circumcincta]